MLSQKDNVSTGYNSNLFYVNTLEFEIADPTVIYITEGEEAGYFYAYGTSDEIGCHGFQAWRSKDLSHWECTGIALKPDFSTTWAVQNYWAPEIIYDEEDKLYYLFYNAFNIKDSNRLYLSVAYSDHPAGPFVSPDGRKDANGNMLYASKPVFDLTINNPVIKEMNETDPDLIKENALDISPFIDPQTGERYVYFSYYDNYGVGSFIYGMKMIDWFTPDYTTLTMLTYPGYTSVAAGKAGDNSQRLIEGSVNEGPFMVYRDGTYYLTLSIFGYTDPNYRVIQAVADSPLGDFVKVDQGKGGLVISTNTNWSHLVSAGHHCFITCGDEMFIAYHTFKNRNDISGGRALGIDKVVWVENQDGIEVMHTNGPNWSVQPLPEMLSGYKNIAPSANVTASNTADGSDVKYLTDEVIKYQEFDLAVEYEAKTGNSVIKLEWDSYKTVRAIMLYNSYNYDAIFYRGVKVEFEYLKANGKSGTAVIEELEYDIDWLLDLEMEDVIPGGSAVAEFNEMPVKSITITVPSRGDAEMLALNEIIVLGKDQACAGIDSFRDYSYTVEPIGSSHIVQDSVNFGTVNGSEYLSTWYGYDLSNDSDKEDAYIVQEGSYDQYAYFKDVYSTSFYIEAEISVLNKVPFANDPYPKFGIAIGCDEGNVKNTIFYYVDAVNYTTQRVGCAQRNFDNSDWDWTATEQLVDVPGISYANGDYVKLAVLRVGDAFYMICNDKVAIYYDSFNIFNEYQEAAVGFLCFNTSMRIQNYVATVDQTVIDQKLAQYQNSTSGEYLGGAGGFSPTSGWDFSEDKGDAPSAVQTLGGDQYVYFKDVNSTTFYVETEISAVKDLYDPYPKFGITTRIGNNTMFFYIDGSSNYTSDKVGYVQRNAANTDWVWAESVETKVPGMGAYKGGEYVKLGMLRNGSEFKMYVNGTCVFEVNNFRGFTDEQASVVGFLSFTTGISVRNYYATTDISSVQL